MVHREARKLQDVKLKKMRKSLKVVGLGFLIWKIYLGKLTFCFSLFYNKFHIKLSSLNLWGFWDLMAIEYTRLYEKLH